LATAALVLACLVMLAGVAGTVIPALPGLPLIWLAALGYGWYEGFTKITYEYLGWSLVVVVLAAAAEHYARAWGAKRFGATSRGAWGAVIGSIAGLFFLPIGLIVGPFLGAALAEMAGGRPWSEAARAGWGGVVGVLGGVLVNFIIAVALVVSFLWTVLT
jgi:uncharacterized protein